MKRRLILVLTIMLFVAACGGSDLIRTFRVALAASGPLVNSLVATGAIRQSDATLITRDFSDGVGCADDVHRAFNAIAKDDPLAKVKKFEGSQAGLMCFQVIIQRRNFDKNPKVQNVIQIAEGVLASLVAFYREPGTGDPITRTRSARAASHPRAVSASTEKELEKKLKQQLNELKVAMQP